MQINHPSYRLLFAAWILLIILTAGSIITGHVKMLNHLDDIWIAALFFITAIKAYAILRWFLNLRAATSGWNTLFMAYLIFLLLSIFAISVFI